MHAFTRTTQRAARAELLPRREQVRHGRADSLPE
jgi:hypothetical protein